MSESSKYQKDTEASAAVIKPLLGRLGDKDGLRRQDAREQLVDMGRQALPYLIKALQSANERVRWEGAKALGELRDPLGAPALVQALEDEEAAIRWLAATGLISIGQNSLRPLLEALVRHSDSTWMREGAHRVLYTLVREGGADDAAPVLEALEDIEPSVEVPIAAYNVLRKMEEPGP
jgi:HEAT repeat protein